MLDQQVENVLNDLIQIENNSSALYLAMSAYLANLNYTGMAAWHINLLLRQTLKQPSFSRNFCGSKLMKKHNHRRSWTA
ncbi:hypothetical protein [Jeotgalibacillus proteolyticus]|uniref:hypothetical protein n=1 Tax=Jeotgalibacillus proteolyticus TaxID=2082395 RepID=UPI002694E606